MTLYEIDKALEALVDQTVDPETGVFDGDSSAWEELVMAREEKIENTALYIKNLRAEATALLQEEQNLRRRREIIENKVGWLWKNLQTSLGGEDYETAKASIRFKKNPPSVAIRDEGRTMAWAQEICPDAIQLSRPTLSKGTLLKLLKDGEDIPGCELVQNVRMEVR